MPDRNAIVTYIVDTYYEDVEAAASSSGIARGQITGWLEHKNKPQDGSITKLLHGVFAPKFEIIAEYVPVETSGTQSSVRKLLAKIFKGHEKASGLYAFYDSMANLIYIGKSDGNLFSECYQQLKAELKGGIFPKGAKRPPKTRLDVVRYFSAYSVRRSWSMDAPKHVESLILRISKPRLNANIGRLDDAEPTGFAE